MYLFSIYFDHQTNKVLQHLIERIALATGNTFMTEHHVPPHLTVSSVEARNEESLLSAMEQMREHFKGGEISIVSPGMFLPYVLYVTPVLNAYLQELSQCVFDVLREVPETKISPFYQPMQWLPHVTLGKTLQREQMQKALEIVQDQFQPISAKAVALGLAKTNPHQEIKRLEGLICKQED